MIKIVAPVLLMAALAACNNDKKSAKTTEGGDMAKTSTEMPAKALSKKKKAKGWGYLFDG